jgi:2-keto-4-pentenoate hydratase
MRLTLVAGLATVAAFSSNVQAACPSDEDIASMAERFANLQRIPNPPAGMSMEDAVCGRDKLTKLLGKNYGRVIGYKAGLTNPAVQKRFNHDRPVRGTLFEKMLLNEGAELPDRLGARPGIEADLIVEVAGSGINRAKTPLEALRQLSRIYPFIELPDLFLEEPAKLDAPGFVYANVFARLGILGRPIPVEASTEVVDALADMTVRVLDGNGKEVEAAKGAVILGQPLNAVLWLVKDLNASGISLKQGDLLSLGSFSRPLPAKPGMAVTVVYDGLPGNPRVSVRVR